jgi:hypothetical protein
VRTQHVVAVVAAGLLAATLVPTSAQAVSDGGGGGLDAPGGLISFGTSGTADGPVSDPGFGTSMAAAAASSANSILDAAPTCAAPGPTDVTITVPEGVSGPFRVLHYGELNDDVEPIELAIIDTTGTGPHALTVKVDLESGVNGLVVQRPQESSTTLAHYPWQLVGYAVLGAPCPAITVTPNPLDRGTVPTELVFELTGFPPESTVVLRIEERQFATVETDEDGSATKVQDVRYPPPCGAYDVGAAVEVEPPPIPHTAATVLNVLCPTLNANPSTLPQDALPGTTTLTGGGWAADTDVAIAWEGGSLVARTNKAGRLTTTMPIDERDCGPLPVTATEQLTLKPPSLSSNLAGSPAAAGVAAGTGQQPQTASTTVTITCVDPPTLLVSPAVTGPGSVTQAVATRLPAGADVLLVWTDATGRPMPGVTRAVVGADGVMRSPILVLPRSATGPRQLVLLDAAAPGSPAVVAAPALIVNNPVEPGRDRLLTRR